VSAHGSRDRPPYGPSDVFAEKYVIRRVLGEGGMAVVYAAVDTSCDRQVALKVLRPSAAAGRAVSSVRMQREAAAAVKLRERSPHVVDVLTAGLERGLPYYVMERLWGTTLRQSLESKRTRSQPFEIIDATGTVIQIATPLAYAHEMRIVHRDVKPENVYIAEQSDNSYIVKLLDFGVSALLADEPSVPRRREFSGSRPYASPEQLDGQPPSPADDVYALGLILFEMLTFTLPHDRMNPRLSVAQTALNALRSPIPSLRPLRPDVPPRLDVLVRNCLAYEPGQRPSALQVATMLRDIERQFERNLLGIEDVAITDVTGPPIAVLQQRLDHNTGEGPSMQVQRVAGPAPVDLFASTDPPAESAATAAVPADHEVFFMNTVDPVAGSAPPVHPNSVNTDRDELAPVPPIAPQPVLMLGTADGPPAAVPASTGGKRITLRMSTAPPAPAVEPRAIFEQRPSTEPPTATPFIPSERARNLVEPLASAPSAAPEQNNRATEVLGSGAQPEPFPPSSPRDAAAGGTARRRSPPPESTSPTRASDGPRTIEREVSESVTDEPREKPHDEHTVGAFGSRTEPEPTTPSSRRSLLLFLAASLLLGLGVAGFAIRKALVAQHSAQLSTPSAAAISLPSPTEPASAQPMVQEYSAASAPEPVQPAAASATARLPSATPRGSAPISASAAVRHPAPSSAVSAAPSALDSEFKTTF
jgi:serine/threonine-protein kinase